jgi:hypothetical protein
MKTKSFLGIVLSVALAMVSLVGCGNKVENVQRGSNLVAGIVISANENTNFREAIANEVNASRAMSSAEHRADSGRSANRVSEITEFYFPTIEIDGFELHSVAIFDSAIFYMYAPIEIVGYVEIAVGAERVVTIGVGREEWSEERGVVNLFDDVVRDAHREGWGYLTESGMMYFQDSRNIVAPWGNTIVRIDVPQELNTYEFLRDLALRVIETMELVTV